MWDLNNFTVPGSQLESAKFENEDLHSVIDIKVDRKFLYCCWANGVVKRFSE